eukprot:TRINITY_DN25864_c1_g1_i7.p3 TRINITY_DN25864_c1_g1~~TRINITY_DN25864_c1_g1_i7.p3  ORF type:complete len:216 (-),score=-22.91 TRINITY_DN25864_c1_g1_i7:120-767(-)
MSQSEELSNICYYNLIQQSVIRYQYGYKRSTHFSSSCRLTSISILRSILFKLHYLMVSQEIYVFNYKKKKYLNISLRMYIEGQYKPEQTNKASLLAPLFIQVIAKAHKRMIQSNFVKWHWLPLEDCQMQDAQNKLGRIYQFTIVRIKLNIQPYLICYNLEIINIFDLHFFVILFMCASHYNLRQNVTPNSLIISEGIIHSPINLRQHDAINVQYL